MLIVHFNTSGLTAQLLASLPRRSSGGRTVQVSVLDNGSTLEHKVALKTAAEKFGAVLHYGNNVGFGRGVNRLVDLAQPRENDIIWILNPDTRPSAECLNLLEDMLAEGCYDVLSPAILSGDPAAPTVWFAGGTVDRVKVAVRHLRDGEPADTISLELFPTEYVTGAAPMMYYSAWMRVGGFPLDYFLYWEDVSWSQRAVACGLRLGVLGRARLWHQAGASSADEGLSATFFYWATRNRFRFAAEIGVESARLIVGPGLPETLRYIARAALQRNGRLSKVRAAIRGTLHGAVGRRSAVDINA